MKKVIILVLVVIIVFAYIGRKPISQGQSTNNTLATVNSHCHSTDDLPDILCTPGAKNPDVTESNIHQTICVKGWTKTIRPPLAVTTKIKQKSIDDYGYVDKNLKSYELDHLIPLELGGAPLDSKNLWAEPAPSPNPKDRIENDLNHKVCSGQLQLEIAQRMIATNWKQAH